MSLELADNLLVIAIAIVFLVLEVPTCILRRRPIKTATHLLLGIACVVLGMSTLLMPIKPQIALSSGNSQENPFAWSHTEVRDTAIRAMYIDPSDRQTIYAGSPESGIYRTTDEGVCWETVNSGLANRRIWALDIDSGGNAYVGTYGDGVYVLPKGRDSWVEKNGRGDTRMGNGYVYGLAIDSDDNIFAGTNGSGVYKSTDEGDSWTQCGLTGKIVSALSISSGVSGSAILATTWGDKIYRLSDSETCSWKSISESIGEPLFTHALITSNGGQTVYSGTAGEGIYKTENGGASWEKQHPGGSKNVVYSLAIGQLLGREIVFAGVDSRLSDFSNSDAMTPSLTATGIPSLSSGVYVTVDGGDSWEFHGLKDQKVYSLLADLDGQPSIYAGTYNGIMKYTQESDSIVCRHTPTPTVTVTPSPTIVIARESSTPTVKKMTHTPAPMTPTPQLATSSKSGYGMITGLVWHDANNDGNADFAESFLEGSKVVLRDDSSDGVVDTYIIQADGNYVFDGLFPGNYTLLPVPPEPPPEYDPPPVRTVYIMPGEVVTVEFGFTLTPMGKVRSLVDRIEMNLIVKIIVLIGAIAAGVEVFPHLKHWMESRGS